VLASFLKCIGFIIPLMDAEHAYYYTREVMVVLKREFSTADEEMKKIVLKVVQQCVGTEGVEAEYVKTEVLPEYFRAFWQRRMALDRRNYRALVETTVSLAQRVSVLSGREPSLCVFEGGGIFLDWALWSRQCRWQTGWVGCVTGSARGHLCVFVKGGVFSRLGAVEQTVWLANRVCVSGVACG
jgi:hypothetical protein